MGVRYPSTAPLASNITINNNPAGTADTMTVAGLNIGDVINIYDAATTGNLLGTATVANGQTSATVSIAQLGTNAGQVYVSVTSTGKTESTRTAKAYDAEVPVRTYDDFNENHLLFNWSTFFDSNTGSVEDVNGRLELGLKPTASGPVFHSGIISNSRISGDFDIQVDYSLLSWPPNNGVRTGLFIGDIKEDSVVVERLSHENWGETYLMHGHNSNGPDYQIQGITNTNDLTGKLRLKRNGNIITSYYLCDDKWIEISSYQSTEFETDPVKFGLAIWSHDYVYRPQGHDIKVVFDNFTINQGTLIAPPSSTAPLASNITVTNNNLVTVNGLTGGDLVKVYDAVTGGNVLGSYTLANGETFATVFVGNLGTGAGQIYVSVTSTGKTESTRTAVSFGSGSDTTAPVTKYHFDQISGTSSGKPFIKGFTVSLQATDISSGVMSTQYRINNGSWNTYTNPFTFYAGTTHSVEYYSTNNAGNDEIHNFMNFDIGSFKGAGRY
jgi:trimeric autotransporter adhesin